MVRAKFIVSEITEYTGNNKAIKLIPVTSGSDENRRFWQLTPSGAIQINTLNPEAAAQFEVGKEYYVDFTRAE